MTINKRFRIAAVFILIIPLVALLITSLVFFITWSLGWEDAEELSVYRFLHAPLLSALRGDEVTESRFAGIILAVDDEGRVVYIAPQARDEMEKMEWDSMEEAYTDIMTKMPNIPINIALYTYQERSGLVLYIEDFFSGRKLFRANTIIVLTMYFGLIVLPILIFSINSRPIMRSLMALETAAYEIGRGNLDSPISIKSRRKKKGTHIKELESLISAFERMRIELKENHENQGRIMMAISHDLKTPLTLVKGYVEALRDGMAETPEQVTEYADVIYDRSMLLEERINDLIYFARLRTSDWQARFEEFSFNDLLNETADIFKNDSQIRKREFTFSDETAGKITINGDRKLLFQVFENLFDNACRYTSNHDRIEITAAATGDLAIITFEDSGDGISEEHRQHIFDSFYRADSGRNTRGIGIGLTSAKTIIENHGGRIYYVPSKLGGAGFVLELPVIVL